MMRQITVAAATLLLLSTHAQDPQQCLFSEEIRGIHSHLLTNDDTKQILNSLKSAASDGMTVVGYIASSGASLVSNVNVIQKALGGFQSLNNYLQDSGVQQELDAILNPRLADNMAILGVVQKQVIGESDRRDPLLSQSVTMKQFFQKFKLEEAARYVKYALAAYGDAAIDAATVDSSEEFDLQQGNWTKQQVCDYIGVPEKDVVLMDVKYDSDATQLRHFVAVDHVNEKVVLAIRGTFCGSELAVDMTAYSRPFCGGEAHAGIATMTERLWSLVEDDIIKTLDKNDGYELIITGHSLGAGSALLLNLLLHQDDRFENQKFRAFAFASPPVFWPLSQVQPEALQTAANYMHDMDDVPLLSGDSVRHIVAALTAVDGECKYMDLHDKGKLILGKETASETLVKKTTDAFHSALPVKKGMPMLVAPVMAIAWATQQENETSFDMKLCDPTLLAKSAIYMDPKAPFDHYPTRYERAFTNIKV